MIIINKKEFVVKCIFCCLNIYRFIIYEILKFLINYYFINGVMFKSILGNYLCMILIFFVVRLGGRFWGGKFERVWNDCW